MPVFPESIKFSGEWRPYQKRVIDNLKSCSEDKKIHIVAAPGSGKTTVGLELIRKLGRPALVLSPSVTIREQWIERFCSSFLPDTENADNWISNSLRSPKPLTVITYQALHSAYTKTADKGESEYDDTDDKDISEPDTAAKEQVDYSDFNLIKTLKDAGIKTICLDEAHHLRSEWWKALEKVINELGSDIFTISLTATPPYDSKPAEWQKYISLCGEIDSEIFTPELVSDNNLCPHQDYVYFNWPQKDETEIVRQFRISSYSIVNELSKDPAFIKSISSHKGISDIEGYTELFLNNPKYLTALMVLMQHNHMELPKKMRELIGTKARLPALNAEWMEVLLQGYLFDDCESYPSCEDSQEELRKKLYASGHIYRKSIALSKSPAIDRMMLTSKGKLNSIREIVRAEYGNLGSGLRLLILTDFIKKDSVAFIGNTEQAINEIGTVPIFEILRRENVDGLKLGVISGGIVIIPKGETAALDKIAEQRKVSVSYNDLNCSDYVEACFKGSNQKQMVSVITELFTAGGINTLVGTKSLLGEGWDAPCVNTLILASFVGSYMLSNQMRGRAIRVFKDVPDKTANIWHLVSMEPTWAYSDNINQNVSDSQSDNSKYPVSEDFNTLRRRFKSFLGVSYTEDIIQDGIERLSIIKPPYNKQNIETINKQMLAMAADRKALRERWKNSIAKCPDVSQVIDVNQAEKTVAPGKYMFFNAVAAIVILTLSQAMAIVIFLSLLKHSKAFSNTLITIWSIFSIIVYIKNIVIAQRFFSPQSRIKQMGIAVLKSLRQTGFIKSENVKVITEIPPDGYTVVCYIDGGTTYEKNVFSECMSELFGCIDNPRYLLVQNTHYFFVNYTDYFAVPEILGGKKENAMVFEQFMKKHVGGCSLVYTRSAEGRKLLLKARAKSFVNRNDKIINKNHRVKSKWE